MTNAMKYKRFVYTPILLILTAFELAAAADKSEEIRQTLRKYDETSKLERILAMWNKSSENAPQEALPSQEKAEDVFERPSPAGDLPSEISKCIVEQQYQITSNFVQGKHIILNCFKGALMLNVLRYLGETRESGIKLFDGLLELERIPGRDPDGCGEDGESCEEEEERGRGFGLPPDRKDEYVRMYKKAMYKLISERKKLHAYRNQTREEKAEELNRIDQNSNAFLSEVIRTLGDENVEKVEEEKLKKEILDPKLLSALDAFSKNYILKFRFYPGAAARMMRSQNGGFTFDVEIQDSSEGGEGAEGGEGDGSSDESSTREIRDGPQAKDYEDGEDNNGDSDKKVRRNSRGKDKKKKQLKKKAKGLKKMLPYLLLPMLIQMTLLPFVFKKLFFLAMKALLAGKMALILVGFNILRNTCINNDDDYHKIRVEHYGYRNGEEYGAWIHGRSLGEGSAMAALSEEPFRGHGPGRTEARGGKGGV